jgi:hypothetical protein
MPFEKPLPLRRIAFIGFVMLSLTCSAFALQQSEKKEKRWRPERPSIGMEISSSRSAVPLYTGSASAIMLLRDRLSIVSPEAAKDFTAITIEATVDNDALKIRLTVIYNDLSDREWWKNKKEKEVGTFTLPVGNSLNPIELLQFGIEPFVIKAISNKPVVLKPEEYPRIFNRTTALEVSEVEKSIEGYRFSLKNISPKPIIALDIWTGNGGIGEASLDFTGKHSLIPPGETYDQINSSSTLEIERYGLTIKMILFSDGTYEGDAKAATRYLAQRDGKKVQSVKLLPLIEQALKVSDEELPEVFEKLEAGLWQMQEAMDKASAIEFLKVKYPAFDEPTISMLYEEFKGGFYNARNVALGSMGSHKQFLQEHREKLPDRERIVTLRRLLAQVKNQYETIISENK